jgi:hypothetical protein
MYRGPVFIGGPDRCGKTTMRAFLTSHPSIAIPADGSNMWTYFYGQYGDLGEAANFARCLEAMLAYKHIAALQPDAERIRREFWEGEPTYARLFALFQRHFAERVGKPRWGDQTGLIERYADPIFAAYPTATMIHMLRDPCERYAEATPRDRRRPGKVGWDTARWLQSARLAERNRRRYPGRYLVVRYEDLVRAPEATLRAVCAFLGEDYAPAMLTMAEAPEHRLKLSRDMPCAPTDGPPLTEAYIGQYRGAVPAREQAFLQLHAGPAMRAYGYEPAPLDLAGERLRFALADWPANLARMLAWLAWESVRQSLPALAGRRVAPKHLVGRPEVAERA